MIDEQKKLNDLIHNQCIEFFKKIDPINKKKQQEHLSNRNFFKGDYGKGDFYPVLSSGDLYTISLASTLSSIIKIHLEKILIDVRHLQVKSFHIQGDIITLEFSYAAEGELTLEHKFQVPRDYEY